MYTKYRKMKKYIIFAFFLVVLTGIAFAALSQNLNITFGNVSQTPLVWQVGFDPTIPFVRPVIGGTSSTGRLCNQVSISTDTVTVPDIVLSKPGDFCRWDLTIVNSGDIAASLSAISKILPTGQSSCETGRAGTAFLKCDNISYSITTDSEGSTPLTIDSGLYLASTDTTTVYLFAKYASETLVTTDAAQSGASFILTFSQA